MKMTASLRKKVRERKARRSRRGFTLIEMLVVVVIITVFASVALSGMAANMFDSTYRRFIGDVTNMVVRARRLATTEQTQVWVEFSASTNGVEAQLGWIDPSPNSATYGQSVDLENLSLAEYDGNRLGNNQGYGETPACVYPLMVGIRAPSQAQSWNSDTGCLTTDSRVVFLPGGTLAYQQAGSLVDLQGAGLVIPIVDQRVPSNRSAVYVQVYPGGLVRATMTESYD